MDRYRFLKEEPEPEEVPAGQRKKPQERKFFVTPAGTKEHTPNPVPPLLRDQPLPEAVPIEKQRSINVALIGPPNVGKSTLLNKFIKDKISATSSKAQTTRTQVVGCTTQNDTQIVFVDTPGIIEHALQKRIPRSMVVDGWSALEQAELVLLMCDASRNFDTAYYPNLFQVLNNLQKESSQPDSSFQSAILFNKIDKILPAKKRASKMDSVSSEILAQYPCLQRSFPISVRSEMNLNPLMDYIISKAKPRAWEYAPNVTCFMSDYQRVMEVIREKIYRRLNKELPYLVEQRNMDWSIMSTGVTRVENYLYVTSNSHKKILVGSGGSTLKYICTEAEETLKEVFGKTFKIVLSVQVKKVNSRSYVSTMYEEGLLGYRLTSPGSVPL